MSKLPFASSRSLFRKIFLLLGALFVAGPTHLFADHIVVAVKPVAPFVVVDDAGHFSGYSIDLWNEVARTLGWTDVEFKRVDTVPALLDALQTGKADVGVGALSVTAERSKLIDFTHPFYDSGLDIMVKGGGSPGGLDLLEAVFTPTVIKNLLLVGLLMIIVSHILWFLERKHNHEDFPRNYAHGIAESIWWTMSVLLGGYCMNKDPRGLAGRIIGTLWAVVGIGVIALMVAVTTTVMTVDTLSGDIKDLRDLENKPVATLQGTSADHYLQSQHMKLVECKTLDEAVEALQQGKAKAVIYDAPIMMYYLAQHDSGDLHLLGHLFDKQKYGFGLQLSSKLRQPLNSALLSIEETDFMDSLDKRYFTPAASQ